MKKHNLEDRLKAFADSRNGQILQYNAKQMSRLALIMILLLALVWIYGRLKEALDAEDTAIKINRIYEEGRGKYDPDLPVPPVDPIRKERVELVPRPVPCKTIAHQALAGD